MSSNTIVFKTSTISDGNMSFRFGERDAVVANRKKFLAANHIDFENHVCMSCNHGEYIKKVSNADTVYFGATSPEAMIQSEVLVTNEKNIALMLLTADCLPVSFYDPVHNVIALAHLNRKTIAHNLGQKTVGFLTEHFNTNPADILVQIGPHIKKESYIFPLPLSEPTPKQLRPFIHEENGDAHIDLPAAEIKQLTLVGIQAENIMLSAINTATSQNYFSYYRSSQDGAYQNGRFATILMMR